MQGQKGTRYIRENVLTLLSSAVFRLQNLVSDFFSNCFIGEIKGFYQISLGHEVDFRDI